MTDPQLHLSTTDCLKIFLVGMLGVGKTYWGERIAAEHGFRFADLDVYISQQEYVSIPAIFAQDGEPGFREKETKYLQQIITSTDTDTIVACGGGTPCFNNNMAVMKAAGTVIYLQADIDTLAQQIKESGEARPLLKGKADVAGYLTELLEQRKAIYEQAHFILHTKDISLITFDKIITSCINRH